MSLGSARVGANVTGGGSSTREPWGSGAQARAQAEDSSHSQAPQWRPGGHDDGWAVQINPPAVGTQGRGQAQDGACHDAGGGLS